VIGEQDLMNPCIDEERIDVREEAIYEIRSESWFSAFIKIEAL
jgi:hypothetical protein